MDIKAIAGALANLVTAVAGALTVIGLAVPETFVADTHKLIAEIAAAAGMLSAFLPGLWEQIKRIGGSQA